MQQKIQKSLQEQNDQIESKEQNKPSYQQNTSKIQQFTDLINISQNIAIGFILFYHKCHSKSIEILKKSNIDQLKQLKNKLNKLLDQISKLNNNKPPPTQLSTLQINNKTLISAISKCLQKTTKILRIKSDKDQQVERQQKLKKQKKQQNVRWCMIYFIIFMTLLIGGYQMVSKNTFYQENQQKEVMYQSRNERQMKYNRQNSKQLMDKEFQNKITNQKKSNNDYQQTQTKNNHNNQIHQFFQANNDKDTPYYIQPEDITIQQSNNNKDQIILSSFQPIQLFLLPIYKFMSKYMNPTYSQIICEYIVLPIYVVFLIVIGLLQIFA